MSGTIKHIKDENDFEKLISSDKTVLVDFFAQWCGPCNTLAPIIKQVSEEVGDDVIIAKCDTDEVTSVAVKFAIRSIPTLILFKKGKEANRLIGLRSKQEILNFIK